MDTNTSYRKAQALLGTSRVLKEQARVIGFKPWSKMNYSEKRKLIDALRKIWIKKENKE